MTLNYTFQTPDHGYDIFPNPLTGTVQIRSEYRDSLEELVSTIELAGTANDTDFSDIEIEEGHNEYDFFYFIEIDKSTLALYLQFEVLNYMGITED